MQLLTGVTVVLGVVTTTVMADGYQTSTQDTHDYLVKFRSEYSEEDFQSFFHQLTRYCEAYDCSARVKQRFHRLLDGGVLTLSSEDHLQQWIQERVEVDKFEADSTISLVFEDVNNVTTESTEYWNLDRIDQRQSELDGFYSYTFNGEGINAYIIDSGIRLTHHEFDRERTRLVDFIDDGNDDCNGHGTHVAGTVGGRTVGVAKGVNLVAVRVFPCEGETTLSILLNGLVWTFEDFLDSGASTAVINLSLSSSASPFLDDVIDVLNDTGLVVISAAGNSDADACLYSPARSASTITVGATSEGDARASFSNHGSCVNIFAPGVAILSAWNSSDSALTKLSGTSMAAPVVTGIAARYVEKHTEDPPVEVASSILCGATNEAISNLPSDKGLTVNLLVYGDPQSIQRVGINEECPVGKDAICSGNSACSGAGDCFNSGRCVCNCGHFGQACQFTADIEELGNTGNSSFQLTRSTQGSPPLFVGSAGSKVFALHSLGENTTVAISTCSPSTNFSTSIGLVDACLNNLLFEGQPEFPWSGAHPNCRVSSGASYLTAKVNSVSRYYILVTGQDQNAEGEFELFVQMSESGEAQFPGDGEASYPTATPSVSPTNTQGETWTASSTSSSPPGRSPGASYSSSRSPTPTASASDRPAPWVEYGPKLDSLESFITITFNTATNRGNVGVTFECLNLLYSDIGEDATLFSECYWTSSRELVIELRSPELDFQQLGKTITAGSKITLIGGLIKQDILSAALPQTTLTVTSPDRSPIVNFEVSHSHVITLCGNIEANVNFATGGSRVRGIEWTWVMKSVHLLNGANITYSNVTRPLRNEIARATRENRDSIFVPQERVPKGITYKLALKGENMFGSSKVREIEFKVERQSAPSITFEEEPSGQIRSSQGALFRASASLKTCEISDVKNPLEFSFKYAWHLLGPNGTFLDVSAFLTRDPRRLVIPAYSLFPSDSSYSVVFRVTAESAQRVLKSSRTIELRVVPSRVVATIAGGTRAIDIFSDLALDASNSGSPEENLPTLPSDWKVGKEYLWTCETKMINCTNFLIGNDSGREMLHVFRRRLQTLKQKVSIDEDLPVLFTVTISLQLSRSGTPTFYSTDSQSVTIIISGTAIPTVVREDFFPGEMPEAVIGGKPHFIVNPGSEVRVTADVKESQETESQWILVDEDPLTLNDIIDSPSVASPLLVVRPNQFFVGNRYTLQYRSQFTSNLAPTASFGFTEIRLSVNRPPRGGRLLIKPFLDITSDVDDVLLEATGWKDEDTPLLYSFYVGFDKNIEYSRTLRWAQENPTVVTKLPTPPNGHKIWIFLEVQDALGASEVYSSSVSVNHPSVEQLENFVVSKREKARECRITKDANCAARAVRDAIRAQNQEILKGDI
eukprot:gb/GECG01003152.1/.p1 GENE.gb/GECG01003152.1/~~gb/GECG01003152.1/.p1  ORF type:complete len:1382 (+),score=150.21 gb/GECG01003152.1/:1-4146(+)